MPLTPVDRLDVLVLVDNVTDSLSSNPPFVETEMTRQRLAGVPALSGACLCCAAHGLSCLIAVTRQGRSSTLLFDTGPDEEVFARNVRLTGADLGLVDAIVVSHGHWDHAGALLLALDMIRQARPGYRVPVHLHPAMFAERGMRQADGSVWPFARVPSPEEIRDHGGDPVLATTPELLLGDGVWVSGEIPRRTPFEPGMPGQQRRLSPEHDWEPDPVLIDERALVIAVAGLGQMVFSACSHAGIVNVLAHARDSHPDIPIHCALGGFHLSGSNEAAIPDTVAALAAFQLPVIAAGHCTGWRATRALANAFGDDTLVPLAVGKRITFAATYTAG